MKLNQGMKKEAIEEFLRLLGKEPWKNYVYGVVPPSMLLAMILRIDGFFIGTQHRRFLFQ